MSHAGSSLILHTCHTARCTAAVMLAAVGLASAPLQVIAAQSSSAARPPAGMPPYTAHDAAVQALYASSLPDPSGHPQSLSRYRGKVTVIHFWASWCAACVKEMPTLSELQHRYAGKDVHFVGIGVDSAQNVSQFLSKVTIDYPIYVAGFAGADLARRLGNDAGGLPFTVVIDQAGHVRYAKLGKIDPEKLSNALTAL